MKNRIPIFNFDKYKLVTFAENNDNVKRFVSEDSLITYIGVFYINISTDLQLIIDKSFTYLDPTILLPIGYFYQNDGKDLILIYNYLYAFSIKEYMERDFLIPYKVAFGICHSLFLYDNFIDFQSSQILLDLQEEPRLLPFFNIKSNDTVKENTNLTEFVNNFLFNINKKYLMLRNSDFFTSPFHQILLNMKLITATNQQNIEIQTSQFAHLSIESIYSSFLNNLVPEIIEIRNYYQKIEFVRANFIQNPSFLSIFQQKNSPFNFLETVFSNKPSQIDKTVFQIAPKDFVNFGLIYMKGEFVPRNIDRALNLFMKASSLSEAWFYIAVCCLSDEKGNDRERAAKYFKLSADKGHAEAAFNFAHMTNSIEYYLIAAERGIVAAFFQISLLCLNNGYIEKALEYAQIGAERYNDTQCIKILNLINESYAIQKDEIENKNKTENNNENEKFNQNETENNNKNEDLNKNETENNNKKEDLNKNETESNNENEKFNQNETENNNENEEFNQNKTENNNKNEDLNKNETENNNKKEDLNKNETENNNKKEDLNHNEAENNKNKNHDKSELEDQNGIENPNVNENQPKLNNDFEAIQTSKGRIKFEKIVNQLNSLNFNELLNLSLSISNLIERSCVYCFIGFKFLEMSQNEAAKLYLEKSIDGMNYFTSKSDYLLKTINDIKSSSNYLFNTENDDSQCESDLVSFILNLSNFSLFKITGERKYLIDNNDFPEVKYELYKATNNKEYLIEAAKMGNVKSLHKLGMLKKAADLGHIKSQFEYAQNLLQTQRNKQKEENFEVIHFYMKKAVDSTFSLINDKDSFKDEGDEIDHFLSLLPNRKDDFRSSTVAKASLYAFEYSKLIEKVDFNESVKYLKMSAELNVNAQSMLKYAIYLKNSKNDTNGFLSYLKKSAAGGSCDAYFILSHFIMDTFKKSKLKDSRLLDQLEADLDTSNETRNLMNELKNNINNGHLSKSENNTSDENEDLKSAIEKDLLPEKLKTRAVSYLLAASKLGSPEAQLCLSHMLSRGICVCKNESHSMKLLKSAAQSGKCTEAMFELALKTDDEKILSRCSMMDYTPAALELAKRQLKSSDRRIQREGERRLKLLANKQQKAETDKTDSHSNLNTNRILNEDDENPVNSYLRKINSGMTHFANEVCEAQYILGSLHFTRQEYKEAFNYLSRSINYTTNRQLNHTASRNAQAATKMLASMLLSGHGVERDEEEAERLYRHVFDDDSRLQLARLYMGNDAACALELLDGMRKETAESRMLKGILKSKLNKIEYEKDDHKLNIEGESEGETIDIDSFIPGKLNKPPPNGFLSFYSNGPQFLDNKNVLRELNKRQSANSSDDEDEIESRRRVHVPRRRPRMQARRSRLRSIFRSMHDLPRQRNRYRNINVNDNANAIDDDDYDDEENDSVSDYDSGIEIEDLFHSRPHSHMDSVDLSDIEEFVLDPASDNNEAGSNDSANREEVEDTDNNRRGLASLINSSFDTDMSSENENEDGNGLFLNALNDSGENSHINNTRSAARVLRRHVRNSDDAPTRAGEIADIIYRSYMEGEIIDHSRIEIMGSGENGSDNSLEDVAQALPSWNSEGEIIDHSNTMRNSHHQERAMRSEGEIFGHSHAHGGHRRVTTDEHEEDEEEEWTDLETIDNDSLHQLHHITHSLGSTDSSESEVNHTSNDSNDSPVSTGSTNQSSPSNFSTCLRHPLGIDVSEDDNDIDNVSPGEEEDAESHLANDDVEEDDSDNRDDRRMDVEEDAVNYLEPGVGEEDSGGGGAYSYEEDDGEIRHALRNNNRSALDPFDSDSLDGDHTDENSGFQLDFQRRRSNDDQNTFNLETRPSSASEANSEHDTIQWAEPTGSESSRLLDIYQRISIETRNANRYNINSNSEESPNQSFNLRDHHSNNDRNLNHRHDNQHRYFDDDYDEEYEIANDDNGTNRHDRRFYIDSDESEESDDLYITIDDFEA